MQVEPRWWRRSSPLCLPPRRRRFDGSPLAFAAPAAAQHLEVVRPGPVWRRPVGAFDASTQVYVQLSQRFQVPGVPQVAHPDGAKPHGGNQRRHALASLCRPCACC